MQKVTTREILATIYANRVELVASFLSQGKTEIPYNLQNFEKDMLMSELVVDPRTIRNKWKILVANGYVREVSEKSHRGVLSIPALAPFMSRPMAERLAQAQREEAVA